jgi:hypothetical protein
MNQPTANMVEAILRPLAEETNRLRQELEWIVKIIEDAADCDERGNRSLVDHILWQIEDEVGRKR